MDEIKILVVDDEKFAREGISELLSKHTGVRVVKECSNGKEAVEAIESLSPDLVFLDIQMPLMNGFEVVKALQADPLPIIIFVTAYNEYALKAFEVNAIDYLLKPFTDERFFSALEKAKKQLERSAYINQHEKLNLLLNYVQNQHESPSLSYLKRLMVKDRGRIVFVQIDELKWIEASDYYVKLHLENKSFLIRETMASLEERLDPNQFIRIHRSSIVNINNIKEIQPYGKDDYRVIMLDGTLLNMGRSWFKKLENTLGKFYT